MLGYERENVESKCFLKIQFKIQLKYEILFISAAILFQALASEENLSDSVEQVRKNANKMKASKLMFLRSVDIKNFV